MDYVPRDKCQQNYGTRYQTILEELPATSPLKLKLENSVRVKFS